MKKGAPIELDEDYVDAITEMSVARVVRIWNSCLDELSRKRKLWEKVSRSLHIHKTLIVDLTCRLYPMTKEGWLELFAEHGQDKAAGLISDACEDDFMIDDWFMLIVDGRLKTFGEDESGIVYPLALFMKALHYKLEDYDYYE